MRNSVVVLALLLLEAAAAKPADLVSRSVNSFSKDYTRALSSSVADGNVFSCPFCVHLVLSLLHSGAGGNTGAQLTAALHLAAVNKADLAQSYTSLLTEINSAGKNGTPVVNTNLVPEDGVILEQSFVTKTRQHFLATLGELVHNSTVRKSIQGPLDATHITSRLNLDVSWKKSFLSVAEGDFTVSPDKKVKARFMTQTETFDFKEDASIGAKVLRIGFKQQGYNVVYILPNKADGLSDVEARLANVTADTLLKDLKSVRMEATIPMFVIWGGVPLVKVLKEMDIEDLFNTRANLQDVSKAKQLYVDSMLHVSTVSVFQNGFGFRSTVDAKLKPKPLNSSPLSNKVRPSSFNQRAAARQTPTSPSFRVDRPFLFYLIWENNVPIAFGRVKNPKAEY